MKNPKIQVNSGDEIIIVIPEEMVDEDIEIDLDELGIDVENMDEDVNITIQVEGDGLDDIFDGEDYVQEPNEWFFDDDPYNIVYYEFPEEDDCEE